MQELKNINIEINVADFHSIITRLWNYQYSCERLEKEVAQLRAENEKLRVRLADSQPAVRES